MELLQLTAERGCLSGVATIVHRILTERLDKDVDTAERFRMVCGEAIGNVVKHTTALTANVILMADERRIMLKVQDDGPGFDVEAVGTPTPSENGGMGLGLIREFGGTVESTPGVGTLVSICVAR